MIEVDLNEVHVPLRWSELYGRRAPVEVEIGAGKGRFLLELAAARPGHDFLAVERARKYHRLCADRAARRGLDNVRLVHTTAEDLLLRLLEPSSVSTMYVLFPDPWPKKRHHKRRLLGPATVDAITRVLEPGARLLVKSDHGDYAEIIRDVLDGAAGLRWLDPQAAFEGLPLSGFEHKYRDQGREIFAFALERTG